MARKRPLNFAEIDLLGVFVPPARVEEIKTAMKEGKSVILEESEFKDPGDDYCKILVDDVCLAYLPGY